MSRAARDIALAEGYWAGRLGRPRVPPADPVLRDEYSSGFIFGTVTRERMEPRTVLRGCPRPADGVDRRPRLTADQHAAIRARYAAGESETALADTFGVSRQAIYYHVKQREARRQRGAA